MFQNNGFNWWSENSTFICTGYYRGISLLKCAIEGNADYLVSDDFKSGMHVVDNINFMVVSSDKFIELF